MLIEESIDYMDIPGGGGGEGDADDFMDIPMDMEVVVAGQNSQKSAV